MLQLLKLNFSAKFRTNWNMKVTGEASKWTLRSQTA